MSIKRYTDKFCNYSELGPEEEKGSTPLTLSVMRLPEMFRNYTELDAEDEIRMRRLRIKHKPPSLATTLCPSTMLKRNVCLASTSAILFSIGVILLFLWQKVLNMIIESQLVLGPDSTIYDLWKKTPAPLNLDLYLWNWTNPQDIHNSSAILKFYQVGPYRYKETKEKVNITWNENNDTVTFRHLKKFYFDEKESVGRADDMITTINPVAVSMVHQAKNWGYFSKKGMSLVLNGAIPDVYLTKPASEILFEGYQDFFLDAAQNVPLLAGSSMPPFKKFAWFYGRNGSETYEGIFNMETGNGNTLGRLRTWNYWSHTPYFPDVCGNVEGSAGELFPANQEKDSIRFFSTDLCRNVKLDYEEDILVHGVKAYKYAGGRSMLDNGTIFPENICFCNGECVPYGIMNISACRYGSPAFVSLPHFYRADPIATQQLEGIDPQKDKHEFFIALEPTTGLPVRVSARLQLNLLIEPVPFISMFSDIPRLFFPVLWFEQNVEMTEDIALMLKLLINIPYIFLGLGIVFLLLSVLGVILILNKSILVFLCKSRKDNQCKKVLSKEEVPLRVSS